MHIHGHRSILNAASLQRNSAAEEAAAAQRAEEVRQRLIRRAAMIQVESDSDADLVIGGWTEGDTQQRQEPHSRRGTGKSGLAEDEQTSRLVSFYA